MLIKDGGIERKNNDVIYGKGVLYLRSNAPANRSGGLMNALKNLVFESIIHSLYFLDSVSSENFLFSDREILKGGLFLMFLKSLKILRNNVQSVLNCEVII